jgi:hypothetical protein
MCLFRLQIAEGFDLSSCLFVCFVRPRKVNKSEAGCDNKMVGLHTLGEHQDFATR